MNYGVSSSRPLKHLDVWGLLTTFRELVRWREWYYSKVPLFLVGMVYAVLRMPQPAAAQAIQMAALFVLLCLYVAFGHVVNVFPAARSMSRSVLAGWSERSALIALAIPCISTVDLALICFDATAAAMTMISVLIAALYSLPPVRLKERGVLGPLAAALAQRTLPAAIIFEGLGAWDVVAVGFTALSTLIGLCWIIVHQLQDRKNDRRSGVRTLATAEDPQTLVAVLHVLCSLECACACGVLATMSYFVDPTVGLAAFAYAVGRGVPRHFACVARPRVPADGICGSHVCGP